MSDQMITAVAVAGGVVLLILYLLRRRARKLRDLR